MVHSGLTLPSQSKARLGKLEMTTISQNPLAFQTAAQGVYRQPLMAASGTSASAHVFSFTMPGHLRTMIAGERLRHVIGSHQCWRSKSKKSSILSKWYVPRQSSGWKSDVMTIVANSICRRWRYTNNRNRTPTSFNDYASISSGQGVLAIPFQRCTYALEPTGFTSCSSLFLSFWLPRTCVSHVSEHLQSSREACFAREEVWQATYLCVGTETVTKGSMAPSAQSYLVANLDCLHLDLIPDSSL